MHIRNVRLTDSTMLSRPAIIRARSMDEAGEFVGRRRTRDGMMTFDSAAFQTDAQGNQLGKRFGTSLRTHDGRTVDSTGAFLVGELERLDQTMHEPLAAVTWSRDIDLREDVTIADEVSSYTISSFGSAGGLGTGNGIGTGKAWSGRNTTQISSVSVDIGKVAHPLRPWDLESKYTLFELESAAKVGRPIDQQKFAALKLKHQMDIDEQVYIGDTTNGDTGLLTSALVTPLNAPNGANNSPLWAQKTPDEILADFNTALITAWANAAFAVVPNRIGLPTNNFGYIATQKVSAAGNMSILKYIKENNLLAESGQGDQLEIVPMKWCNGAGVGGTIGNASTVNRMIVYNKNKDYVRFPMTLLGRTPVQYDGIYHKTTYYCRLGVVETVYPETIFYLDGI
jgi:hypothetical protein